MSANRGIRLLSAADQNYHVMSDMQKVTPLVEDVLSGATSRDCRSNPGHFFPTWTVESRKKKVLAGQFHCRRDAISGERARRFHR
jgi:hypothetical protein